MSPLKILIVTLCLLGLLWQLYEVTNQYFKFQTMTSVGIQSAMKIKNPGVHVCFKHLDLLNRKMMNSEWKTNYTKTKLRDEDQEAIDILSRIRISEMFRWTPSVKDILVGCRIRKPGRFKMTEKQNSTECNKDFDIRKFFHRESMCYEFMLSFSVHNDSSFEVEKVTLTANQVGTIFQLFFNMDQVSQSDLITTYAQINRTDNKLLYGSGLTVPFRRHPGEPKGAAMYNRIKLTYHTIESKRLTVPYDSNCRNYGSLISYADAQYQCRNRLLIKRINQVLALVPIFNESLNARLCYGREEIDVLMKTQRKCYSEFGGDPHNPQLPCQVFLTVSNPSFRYHDRNELILDLTWPSDVNFHVDHSAVMKTIDLIVYVFGTLGVWFGFSFYTGFLGCHEMVLSNPQVDVDQLQDLSLKFTKLEKMEKRIKEYIRVVNNLNQMKFQDIDRRIDLLASVHKY